MEPPNWNSGTNKYQNGNRRQVDSRTKKNGNMVKLWHPVVKIIQERSERIYKLCCILFFGKARELGHLYVWVCRLKSMHTHTHTRISAFEFHLCDGDPPFGTLRIHSQFQHPYNDGSQVLEQIRNWPMLPSQNDDWLSVRLFEGDHPKLLLGAKSLWCPPSMTKENEWRAQAHKYNHRKDDP